LSESELPDGNSGIEAGPPAPSRDDETSSLRARRKFNETLATDREEIHQERVNEILEQILDKILEETPESLRNPDSK
jgi:hypothetical protein